MRIQTAPVFAFVLLSLQPSWATTYSAPESACRNAIAEASTQYARAAAKVVATCNQHRSTGSVPLSVDCGDVSQADADGRLALTRTQQKSAVVSACSGSESLLSSDYTACPAPAQAADDGGATANIDDFGEVADCMFALGDAEVGALGHSAQGNPDERLLKPLRKCQGRLAKGTGRILQTIMTERRSCQNQKDVQGSGTSSYDCDGADPRGRILEAEQRFVAKVTPSCQFSSDVLAKLQACSSDTNGLLACATSSTDDDAGALIRDAYGVAGTTSTTTTTLPGGGGGGTCGQSAPQCDGTCPTGTTCATSGGSCHCVSSATGRCAPAVIKRSILSHYSTERHSVTELNAGWSGLAHVIDVPDHAGDILDVNCDDNCENCTVKLHTDDATGAVTGCHCTSNSQTTCNVINGSDPASCGSVDPTCRCFFGAPLPISAGGNPACVALRLRNDEGGTMDLRTGEWHDSINLAAVVYLGLGTSAPCPTCDGDKTPNDGVYDGTCSNGIGTKCDVNGIDPTFGPISNDCLPPSASNISGTGLIIDVNLTSGTSTLKAELPCDTPTGALCPCRTCTGNSLLSCSNNSECSDVGAGTCTASGGAGVIENQCTNFECGADGLCTQGPAGSGYAPCTSDTDCTTSSAGHCTILGVRKCFPDPITNTGTADIYNPVTVSSFCVAPTSNPAINLASGLPGPGALLLTFDQDIRCKSDMSVPYDFPSGANCPGGTDTTSTTLLPLPMCADATAPVCGGVCPTGETCNVSGTTCSCTGLPLPSCDSATAPVCGGACSGTDVCMNNNGTCQCQIATLPQCSEASAPVCGGLCPTGELCQSIGSTCECGAPGAPPCGAAIAPTCAGLCDEGQVCIDNNNSCGCATLPLPTCAQSTAPGCVGTCSTGSLCQSNNGACQCTPAPIP
jgi:hypothetical protein